jgi:hypothetical protein
MGAIARPCLRNKKRRRKGRGEGRRGAEVGKHPPLRVSAFLISAILSIWGFAACFIIHRTWLKNS